MDVIAHIFKYLKKAIEENIEPVKLKDMNAHSNHTEEW